MLRYWDGAAWTEHVTAKQQTTQDASMPIFPGATENRQQTWQYGQPSTGQQQAPSQQPGPHHQEQTPQPPQPWPQQQQQQQQDWPAQQQQPQQPWPPQTPPPWQQQQWQQQQWQQQPWPAMPPTDGVWTPDGARVTTWGKRFAARLLDVIFVFIATLPLTGYFLYRSYQALSDQMDNGTYDAFAPSAEVVTWEMVAIGIFVVAGLAYETICLRRWGATPGKRTLDIRVRSWDHDGKPAWTTVVRRVGLLYGLAVVILLPLVGILALLACVLNCLWPLWDKRRQALHDKAAGTVVIEGWRSGVP
jgi:uncharacterized RDD family membrane protein YckC